MFGAGPARRRQPRHQRVPRARATPRASAGARATTRSACAASAAWISTSTTCASIPTSCSARRARASAIARWALEGGRVAIAAQALGVGQAALDEALAYAKTRHTFGQPIANYQAIQWMLADMATELDAARMLTLRAAAARTHAGAAWRSEAAMAKLFASEAAHRAADKAMQILASAGYRRGSRVERLFRDVRGTEIYQGTSEVQRMIIAANVLEADELTAAVGRSPTDSRSQATAMFCPLPRGVIDQAEARLMIAIARAGAAARDAGAAAVRRSRRPRRGDLCRARASPSNKMIGVGFGEPVDAAVLDAIEAAFAARGARAAGRGLGARRARAARAAHRARLRALRASSTCSGIHSTPASRRCRRHVRIEPVAPADVPRLGDVLVDGLRQPGRRRRRRRRARRRPTRSAAGSRSR